MKKKIMKMKKIIQKMRINNIFLSFFLFCNIAIAQQITEPTLLQEVSTNPIDIAYEKCATKEGPYSILDKIIKTGSKIAINISEKI